MGDALRKDRGRTVNGFTAPSALQGIALRRHCIGHILLTVALDKALCHQVLVGQAQLRADGHVAAGKDGPQPVRRNCKQVVSSRQHAPGGGRVPIGCLP